MIPVGVSYPRCCIYPSVSSLVAQPVNDYERWLGVRDHIDDEDGE